MNKENQKPMIKGIVICVLSLVLLICIPFINSLISERQSFQAEVTNEVTSKWGQHQTIYGPFIYVEYQKEYVLKDNNVVKKTNTNLIMPINQSITGDLKTQIKKRSLYEVTLYNADLMLNAQFQNLETIAKKLKLESPAEFTKVKLIFAISDSRGFMQQITVNNTPSLVFEQDPNLENNSSLNLLSCDLTSLETPMTEVSFPLQLKGSTQLNFLATAKQNKVNLKTDYSDIKYIGNYLPDTENQEISQTDPSWTIFQSFPVNTNLKDTYSLEQFSYGLEFMQMNDFYSKVNRSTKYALLFIGLTFATFFFMENLKNLSINLLHYVLVGFALCINFVLLLSFSEYLGFSIAYIISASATILLITTFIYGLSKNLRISLTIFGLLSLLYAFLFFLLQLKEAALIVGSVGLFAILAILMYFSKRMNFNKSKNS